MSNPSFNEVPQEQALRFQEVLSILIVFSVIALISNWVGSGHSFLESLPGMCVLIGMILISMGLKAIVPFPLPLVGWVSIISVLLTLPISPVSQWILLLLSPLSFLSIVTPVLAYAALAISDTEINIFKRSGLKIVCISILVFTGTYLGSVIVADFLL